MCGCGCDVRHCSRCAARRARVWPIVVVVVVVAGPRAQGGARRAGERSRGGGVQVRDEPAAAPGQGWPRRAASRCWVGESSSDVVASRLRRRARH
eukprot:COSAG01_NODE_8255_length_2855_cov_5.639695_3_plen_95_part_00